MAVCPKFKRMKSVLGLLAAGMLVGLGGVPGNGDWGKDVGGENQRGDTIGWKGLPKGSVNTGSAKDGHAGRIGSGKRPTGGSPSACRGGEGAAKN